MLRNNFVSQMERLKQQFKQAYSEERMKILWREVQDITDLAFERMVDRFLGECRVPPLVPEFREQVAKDRETAWSYEKRQHTEHAEDLMQVLTSHDDVRTICENIRKRLKGRMSDRDWDAFQKMIKNVTR